MAVLALEAIKVVKDSDGKEVVFEPKTDLTTIPTGKLVETIKGKDQASGAEVVIEAGTKTTHA